ncbi:MAG: antitoxin family protein [Methanosarcinales archaeon]|nr:antitoxin family protein [Methanosarcinales archaeon]
MKAIYKDEVLKPLTKPDLREGGEVEISIVPMSLSKCRSSVLVRSA